MGRAEISKEGTGLNLHPHTCWWDAPPASPALSPRPPRISEPRVPAVFPPPLNSGLTALEHLLLIAFFFFSTFSKGITESEVAGGGATERASDAAEDLSPSKMPGLQPPAPTPAYTGSEGAVQTLKDAPLLPSESTILHPSLRRAFPGCLEETYWIG